MKQNKLKSILFITFLIAVAGVALAYSGKNRWLAQGILPGPDPSQTSASGIVSVSGQLTQTKILKGSNGHINLTLDLRAGDIPDIESGSAQHVDMVVVLDRSGSMKGRKIEYARQAVLDLIAGLSAKDRFALLTYSDTVQQYSGLLEMEQNNLNLLQANVRNIRAGGGTNLGAGLQAGITLLQSAVRNGNIGKVVLISDGLANKGITDSNALAGISAVAAQREFSVSTVGVGSDFNEFLMTTIADHGTGNYYYLENPAAFAEVFQQEFLFAKTAAATNLAISVPTGNGIQLLNASGYPIHYANGYATFHPGNLRFGQHRTLYLTLQVPTQKEQELMIDPVRVRYSHGDHVYEVALKEPFTVACVANRKEVYSSIDKTGWTKKVMQEDFSRLKQEVAADIKAGKKSNALQRIDSYHEEQEKVNAVVGSAKVQQNLEKDVEELRELVNDTFQGAPAAVEVKQKSNSKSLQYEGYRDRRSN